MPMIIILSVIAILFVLYALSVRGRTGHEGLAELRGWSYAHRGLHSSGIPENSMAAFRAALEGGYGIELDIHLMADGNLAVIHDASLKRTAGADVKIEDLSTKDLAQYHLEDTHEQIPTFSQVLELYAGKAPLIVELKPEKGNYAALTKAACDALENYPGIYCMESFDPKCIYWLKKNRPQIIRGQLATNYLKNKRSPLPFFLKFVLTHQLENFLTQPDFIAYKFHDRQTLGNALALNLWKMQGVTWTVKSQAEYDLAVKEGWLPIFEGFTP